jgi:hypothetical protein
MTSLLLPLRETCIANAYDLPSLDPLLTYHIFPAEVILFFFFPQHHRSGGGKSTRRGWWWVAEQRALAASSESSALSPTYGIASISTVDDSTSGRLHIVAEKR